MRPPFPSHRASRWSMPHPPAAAPVHGGRHSLTSLPVAYDFHLASCFPSALQPHDEPVRRHQSAPQPRLRSGRQQIVDTGHRAALEGSDRGSRSGCMLDAPPHLDCGWRRPSMPPTSSRPSGLPPLPDNKEHRRVRPRVPLLGILRRGCSTSSLAWEENVQHGQLEHGEEKPSPMRVAGLFRGCGGRGCRGKLYLLGTGDLAGAAAGPVPGQALSPGH
ncbi:uncharacterized protein LOC119339353 isoform X3 [Triticum dicoccoides]|uniref:uncharacterized protein LOC119339353 isoform X3 n=1 Tax=Triticum dicoccoides TaxID=85692 RepID=UPI0018917BFA|nr:uncharacterized protein LOC119339353 isoform X3 [Triticum dicoccoides]XP_044435154.1 uncharacterized protein LOC123161382 isoform X1 [Triticum aestivum]